MISVFSTVFANLQTNRRLWFLFLILATVGVLIAVTALSGRASPIRDEYDPSRYGIPDKLANYKVLAVITEENFICINPGEKRLVLQATAQTPSELIEKVNSDVIVRELQRINIQDIENWTWSFTDSSVTRGETVRLLRESFEHEKEQGCTILGGPIVTPTEKP